MRPQPFFKRLYLARLGPVSAPWFAADVGIRNGLVARWQVRPWTTVVGTTAAKPFRP